MALANLLPFLCLLHSLHVVTYATSNRFEGEMCDVIPVTGCFCWEERGGKRVSCHGVHMSEIPILGLVTLDTLEITGTELRTVDNWSLHDVEMRKLYLNDNKIDTIEELALTHSAYSLVYLDLSHNLLRSVPAAITDALFVLKTLVLTDNVILEMDLGGLYFTNQLQSLFLDYNPIEYRDNIFLHDSMWHTPTGLSQWEKLVISFDNSRTPPSLNPNTMMWDMRRYMKVFIIRNTNLQQLQFGDSFERLEYVGLDHDGLTQEMVEDEDAFETVNQGLRGLSLVGNQLTAIPMSCIARMPLLEELDLSENGIDGETSPFPALSNLKVVKLGGNHITLIADHTFDDLPSLEFLDLSGNALEHFNPMVLSTEQLANVQLMIGRNPLSGDCSNQCLIAAIQEDAAEGQGPFVTSEIYEDLVYTDTDGSEDLLLEFDLTLCCPPDRCCESQT